MKNLSKNSIHNGKKGGRPKNNSYLTGIHIPGINAVILTEHQYNTLSERFGIPIFEQALKILDEWLTTDYSASKYKGKNNYSLFRSDGWVINEARNTIPQT